MVLNSRQQEIMQILKAKGSVSTYELSKTLFASEMTIRRDLTEMEKSGFLRRYRGGAVLKINLGEMPIKERLLLYKEEKEALAKRCLPYEILRNGAILFIQDIHCCQYHICSNTAMTADHVSSVFQTFFCNKFNNAIFGKQKQKLIQTGCFNICFFDERLL